jgi:carboxyl-terminal processing protease
VPPLPPDRPAEAAAQPTAFALAALYEAAWRASPALRQAGPEGMLKSGFEELFNHLDPYSRYLTPDEARGARLRRIGQAGLGLRLASQRGGGVVLAAVAPESPAARAGLRVGDRVLAVDGIALATLDLAAATALLEGPEGSIATLRLQRGRNRPEVQVQRSPVPPETVQASRREGTLWIRIAGFSQATDSRLADILGEAFVARSPAPSGVVLDLRGNRGGLLSQAVGVAGAFLPGGVVARTGGRHPDAIRTYAAPGPDLTDGAPLVVLIDGRSASAAEIVAAALADRRRAVVVGSASMGKGLIQAVVPLPNGGELLVTWSRVLAPQGWPIQGLGVLPALCTSLGAEATARALAALRRGEAPMGTALARQRAARAPVAAAEVAQLRAACPPAEGREADTEAARALLASPEAYAAARGR